MKDFQDLLVAIGGGVLILGVLWARSMGWKRGLLSVLLRTAWLLPIALAVFPRLDRDLISSSLSLKTIHLLLDDSVSMRDENTQERTTTLVENIESRCQQLACRVQIARLSELGQQEVAAGYTPLATAVKSWLPLTHSEPWILVSDGGDSQPNQTWSPLLKDLGRKEGRPLGMVLASPHDEQDNIWLDMVSGPDFGFDQKVIELEVSVNRRSQNLESELTVQLQASAMGRNLASLNVSFRPGEESLNVQIPLPPLARGTHLIKINALPIGTETAIWDNTIYKSLEILPNTIGLLHLLGAPSWDGRYVRRYLKSEPKYDMISFFILRDPTDVQLNNERELSLIPFPVERLFNEELPNFRAVVIQNFSLYQFLEPAYQKNLVDFVLKGGGLLFIGGPRALHELDISSSPLASLLPFKVGGGQDAEGVLLEDGAVPYDSQARFQIKLAEPDREKRLLATVYDDWAQLNFELEDQASFQGLHRLDRVQLMSQGFTPLLTAQLSDGRESLLAAASYPGKGRAIWIFSDNLWKLASNPGPQGSRETYHSFLRAAMTWLLREEMQRPLWLQDFSLHSQDSYTGWSAKVRGPAARFLNEGSNWSYKVCGQVVDAKDTVRQMVSSDQWQISGILPARLASGVSCDLSIEGEHPAFGLVKASIYGIVPELFADKDMDGSFHRLQQLTQLTGAQMVELDATDHERVIEDWLRQVTGELGVVSKTEQKLQPDYFWVLDTWWCYLLLLCLPLEVLVRRWDAYFGSRGGAAARDGRNDSGLAVNKMS